MSKVLVLSIVAIFVLNVLACAPQAEQAPQQAVAPGAPAKGVGPSATAWDELVAQAKKEETVMIYSSSGPELRTSLTKAFQDKFDITLDWVIGRGAETDERILRERNIGLFLADIYLGGTSNVVTTLKAPGVLAPVPPVLILPEVTDTRLWLGGKLSFVDSENQYILIQAGTPTPGVIVNPEVVKRDEFQSFRDLLNPKWKGMMTMDDPTTNGAGARWFRSVSELMGMDFMRELAKQQPTIMRNDRLRFEWVARGKQPITVGHKTDMYAEFVKAGAPVTAYYLKEGAWMTARGSGISLIDKAPHPNAARVFINWLLTKEGQTIHSRGTMTQSLRLDAPFDHLTPEEVRKPGAQYIMVENEAYLAKDPDLRKTAKEVFKDLVQ